jgi:hypothetical protein
MPMLAAREQAQQTRFFRISFLWSGLDRQ